MNSKNLSLIITSLLTLQPLSSSATTLSPFAEILLWQASEQAAATWTNVFSSSNNTTVFSPRNIRFDWSPGARIGFTYKRSPEWFDTQVAWTYVPTNKNLDVRMATQIITPEFFSGYLSGNFFFGANINWKIAMNNLDVAASHTFHITPSFDLTALLGVKATSINQTINASWDALIYTATEKVNNDFLGLGPNLGLSSAWKLTDTTNIVAHFSTAFLWGQWQVNDTYNRPYAAGGLVTPTTITTTFTKRQLGTMMFDYFLGAEWVHPKKSPIIIKFGYEMQVWPNQLRVTTFQQLPVHGDLTFQGLTCRLTLD